MEPIIKSMPRTPLADEFDIRKLVLERTQHVILAPLLYKAHVQATTTGKQEEHSGHVFGATHNHLVVGLSAHTGKICNQSLVLRMPKRRHFASFGWAEETLITTMLQEGKDM